MHSTGPIDFIFERNLFFIIIHHPAKFHQNQSKTFLDYQLKELQAHTQTDRHIHANENNTCQKIKFFGQVKMQMLDSSGLSN